MKSLSTKDGYLISIEPKEEIVSTLVQYARSKNIKSATFTAIGAVSSTELGYYELSEKQYHWKNFEGTIEIVSAIGNIAWLFDEPVIHLHGVFSGTDFSTFAGHVRSATVSAACEVVLTVYDEKLTRAYDEETGLNLWKLVE